MARFKYRRNRKNRGQCARNCCGCRRAGPLSLDHLRPGEVGVICSLGCEGGLRRRLLDMGLTPNTPVMVRKVAPFGDPIELCLRNYELSIRKEDARLIQVKDAKDSPSNENNKPDEKEEHSSSKAGTVE